jgi:hypothetical protein
MWPSVRAAWRQWNEPNEGWEPFLYTDAKGLVTCGMGNLVNTVADAQRADWRNPDGSKTSPQDVAAAWQVVHDAFPAVTSTNCARLTSIRLTDAGIQALVDAALTSAEAELVKSLPDFAKLCADEQTANLSKAWAMGGDFIPADGFTRYAAEVEAGSYAGSETDGNYRGVGTQGRQAQEHIAEGNAQVVKDNGLDPSRLYWPADLTQAPPGPMPGGGFFGGVGVVLLLIGLGLGGVYAAAKGWL